MRFRVALFLLLAASLGLAQTPNLDTNIKGSRPPYSGVDSGTTNTYVLTTSGPLGPTLRTLSRFYFLAANANTGASTLNVDGTGVLAIKEWSSGSLVPLVSGDISVNQWVEVMYDGTEYQMISAAGTGTGASASSTYRTCVMIFGADNGSTLANADIGPQGRQCFAPYNATVQEIEVTADAGTPNVILAVNHAGVDSNLVSTALATASSGGIACSNTGGTLGFDGVTTCSATLQNTSILQGDYVEAVSGSASTAKRLSVFITWSQPGVGTGGTVTSVGISFPSGFSCGSPVVSAGTLSCTWSVAGADRVILSTAANTAGFSAAISTCGDGTHALNYDATTHAFGCQALSGGGGTPGGSSGDLQYNNAGAFGGFADGTSTQVLHGGRTFSAVDLANDVTGNLPVANLNSGTSASSSTFWRGDATWATPSGAGTVTTTGTPASGNLTKFSASTSITNGDLSGDVTTSGTLATTLANTAVTPGSYTSTDLTVDAKGRITAASNGTAGAGTQYIYVPNCGTTGTTNNKLAKWHSSYAVNVDCAVITSTADGSTGIQVAVIGVVISGGGTTGFAKIAIGGQASLQMDSANGAIGQGDSIQISSTVAGDGTPIGGTPVSPANENPNLHFIFGTADAAGSAGAVVTVNLTPISPGFGNVDGMNPPVMSFLGASSYGGTFAFPMEMYQTKSTIASGVELIAGRPIRFADPTNASVNYSRARQCGSGSTCGLSTRDLEIDTHNFGFNNYGQMRFYQTTFYSSLFDNGNSTGTVNFYPWLGNVQKYTLTGNTTISNNTGLFGEQRNPGTRFTFQICQDGTGGRTLTWPADFINAPTIASAASACTFAEFLTADSTHTYYLGSTSSGSGTVTHTGSLTSGQLLIGNGTADITVGDLSGDITTSGSTTTTLASVVTAGSCGDATHSCGLTYDAKGRITAASNTTITGGGGSTVPAYGGTYCTASGNGAGTSQSCSSVYNVVANELIIATCGFATNVTASFSDTLSLTWTSIDSVINLSNNTRESAWWANPGATTGADTFTCTGSGSFSFWGMSVSEVVGATLGSPIDAHTTATTSAFTVLSLSPSSNTDLVFLAMDHGGGGTYPANMFTVLLDTNIANNVQYGVLGPYNVRPNLGTNGSALLFAIH